MTLEQHRAHLFNLLSPPTTWHWWPHVERRAAELAADSDLALLPEMVKAEYERIRKSSKANGSIPASTDEPRSK